MNLGSSTTPITTASQQAPEKTDDCGTYSSLGTSLVHNSLLHLLCQLTWTGVELSVSKATADLYGSSAHLFILAGFLYFLSEISLTQICGKYKRDKKKKDISFGGMYLSKTVFSVVQSKGLFDRARVSAVLTTCISWKIPSFWGMYRKLRRDKQVCIR